MIISLHKPRIGTKPVALSDHEFSDWLFSHDWDWEAVETRENCNMFYNKKGELIALAFYPGGQKGNIYLSEED